MDDTINFIEDNIDFLTYSHVIKSIHRSCHTILKNNKCFHTLHMGLYVRDSILLSAVQNHIHSAVAHRLHVDLAPIIGIRKNKDNKSLISNWNGSQKSNKSFIYPGLCKMNIVATKPLSINSQIHIFSTLQQLRNSLEYTLSFLPKLQSHTVNILSFSSSSKNDHTDSFVDTNTKHNGILFVNFNTWRTQYNFQIDLRVTIKRKDKIFVIPYSILDLTIEQQTICPFREKSVIYKVQALNIISLSLLGWSIKSAMAGEPISAAFYVFYHIQKYGINESELRSLDKLTTHVFESFPKLPIEFQMFKYPESFLSTQKKIKLRFEQQIPGLWCKNNYASEYMAFKHDFYVTLRKTLDAVIVSCVLRTSNVSAQTYIDTFILEDLF